MLPGWGDRPGRAEPTPLQRPRKAGAGGTGLKGNLKEGEEWTVVGGRRREAKPAPLSVRVHDAPSTDLRFLPTLLARPLAEVGRDVLVAEVLARLKPWAPSGVRRALLLGLGPPSSSPTSRHQLALALLLAAALPTSGARLAHLPSAS